MTLIEKIDFQIFFKINYCHPLIYQNATYRMELDGMIINVTLFAKNDYIETNSQSNDHFDIVSSN